jgi:anti-sigma factor RsiW
MKKTCNEITPYLSRYQDGELENHLRETVEVHLEECSKCRRELVEMNAITGNIKRLPEVETGMNFTARVMATVQEKEKPRRYFLPSLVYSLVFIIFCLLGLALNPTLKSPLQEEADVDIVAVTEAVDAVSASDLLAESQQLALINVQNSTFEMIDNDR